MHSFGGGMEWAGIGKFLTEFISTGVSITKEWPWKPRQFVTLDEVTCFPRAPLDKGKGLLLAE